MCYIALNEFLNKSFHLILIRLSQNAQFFSNYQLRSFILLLLSFLIH